MIAKHLDYDHWCFLHPDHKPTERFWLAMWAPQRSKLKALDLDNKDHIFGYTQAGDGPLMPVTRIPLQRFRELKRIYDEFPEHIWCISSETLGLHVWEKLPVPVPISDIHRANRPRLKRIGVNVPEIHPMFGRCFRRPFGPDYATVTDNSLLTNWIDQLDYFEHRATTPGFPAIFQALRGKLLAQWRSYDVSRLLNRNRTSVPKQVTGDQLRQELEEIDAWAAKGFPEQYGLPISISMVTSEPASPQGRQASTNCAITLSEVCNAEWVQNCESWAVNGLPCDDSLFLVVSQLARWLFFVEFFDLPEDLRLEKTKDLLVRFCIAKHNGYISRLTGGSEDEVIEHVGRAVQSGITNADVQFKAYCAIMRQKREQGRYKRVLYLEPILAGTESRPTGDTRRQPDSGHAPQTSRGSWAMWGLPFLDESGNWPPSRRTSAATKPVSRQLFPISWMRTVVKPTFLPRTARPAFIPAAELH